MDTARLTRTLDAFDAYNANDPNQETYEGKVYPKEVLYAQRMTARLHLYSPQAPEYIQLAIRCQHIGRWEIARKTYPMDKKGYLQWRNVLKSHHERVAEKILLENGYDRSTIDIVKFLLQKRELLKNPQTQLLEDVVCLVFIEFYLEGFAKQHEEAKVIDIIRKTMKKMTHRAIQYTSQLNLSDAVKTLLAKAAAA